MDRKKAALLAAGTSLVAVAWLHWWIQPERQVPRAQSKLTAALERRNFEDMSRMLANDYRDRWQQDKSIVLDRCRQVFGQFAILTIERDTRGLQVRDGRWALSEKIKLKGLGGPIAKAARDEVNALQAPFITIWHQRSWKPWDWELTSVEQPDLDLP